MRIAFAGLSSDIITDRVGFVAGLFEDPWILQDHLPLAEMLWGVASTDEDPSVDWVYLTSIQQRTVDLLSELLKKDIISPRCGLDETAAMILRTEAFAKRREMGLQLPKEQEAQQFAIFNRTKSITQVILNLAEEEVSRFWDRVYLTDKTDEHALKVRELANIPAFSQKVSVAPSDPEEAEAFFKREAELWNAR